MTTTAAQTVTQVPCDDCGQKVSMSKMPEDWPFDWWTHKLNGQACRESK